MGLKDTLKGKPTEREQERADTKSVFEEIAQLAPQLNFSDRMINYDSRSLTNRIRGGDNPYVRNLSDLLNLKPLDSTHVYFPPQEDSALSPDSLWLQRGSLGRSVTVDFDKKSFALDKIILGNQAEIVRGELGTSYTRDQRFLLSVFETIRDDLIERRTAWRDGFREDREAFADKLRELGKSTAVAVARVLNAFSKAFNGDEYSVFGIIEKKEKAEREEAEVKQLQVVRLFTTLPMDEEIAEEIYGNTSAMDGKGIGREGHYENPLDKDYVCLPTWIFPQTCEINPRKLRISYPRANLQITVESLYPLQFDPIESRNQHHDIIHRPEDDGEEILEQHFTAFLAGREPGIYPIMGRRDNAVLLLKSPNAVRTGVLFDTKFLNKPGDFGV